MKDFVKELRKITRTCKQLKSMDEVVLALKMAAALEFNNYCILISSRRRKFIRDVILAFQDEEMTVSTTPWSDGKMTLIEFNWSLK
jgi:hypothetical protein